MKTTREVYNLVQGVIAKIETSLRSKNGITPRQARILAIEHFNHLESKGQLTETERSAALEDAGRQIKLYELEEEKHISQEMSKLSLE